MQKWILILALFFVFFTADASAELEKQSFVEEIQNAKYAVVTKIKKIEFFWCGFNVHMSVVDDLKGNAPKDFTVAIPITNSMRIDAFNEYFVVVKTEQNIEASSLKFLEFEPEIAYSSQIKECESKLSENFINNWGIRKISLKMDNYDSYASISLPEYIDLPDDVVSNENLYSWVQLRKIWEDYFLTSKQGKQ